MLHLVNNKKLNDKLAILGCLGIISEDEHFANHVSFSNTVLWFNVFQTFIDTFFHALAIKVYPKNILTILSI